MLYEEENIPSSLFCSVSSPSISSWVTMRTPMMHKGVRRRSGDDETFCSDSNEGTCPPSPKKPRCSDVPPAVYRPVSNPSVGKELISNLPDECIRLIFSLLPSPRDRCSCAAVSRKWLLLQANMRPADFQSLSTTPTRCPYPQDGNASNAPEEDAAVSRCLHSHKANDARLAAMAVGSCARGAPTELVIRATSFFDPSPNSSLLAVSDKGLNVISRACPKLKSLILCDCLQVGNEGLAAVARNCPSLEKLQIFDAPLVDDGGLILIALNCPRLSDLSLETCPRVGDQALQTIARFSSNLESITLENCPLVRDAGLVALFSSLPRLAKVRIANANVGDAALAVIGASGERNPIRSICLENVTGFTHVGFRRLGLAASLQSLTVRCSCASLNDACFGNGGSSVGVRGAVATFGGLKSVTVRNCGSLTDGGLVQFSQSCKQLESLQLEKCHSITTTGLMAAIANQYWSGTLRVLSLVKCNGVGTTQKRKPTGAIKRCPLLQSLTIKRCPGVGDQFLSVFGRALVRARRISVVGMGSITDMGFISFLASMESRGDLLSVDLSRCPGITDWSVAALVSASGGALRRLALEGCEGVTDRSLRMIGLMCPGLVELDLSRCGRISDGGVAGLLGSGSRAVAGAEAVGGGSSSTKSRLQVLSLEGCGGITDESLSSLEEMVVQGSLAGLNLKHCGGLRQAGIHSLRQTLWWCDLIC